MNIVFSQLTGHAYKRLLKPILFKFDPEIVHKRMVATGKKITNSYFLVKIMEWMWAYSSKKTMKKIDGITFPNLVGLAAGFDYNADLIETLPSIGFGFHTIGTITLEAYQGNPPPRLTRFPDSQSILVNKGLKNDGVREIINKIKTKKITIPLGISIASTNKKFKNQQEQINDITQCFKLVEKAKLKHSYYELNISCPNTFGGQPFTTPGKLEILAKAMDDLKLDKPMYVKMPIDQSDSETLQLLEVLAKHNIQGVIFGNLTKDKNNPDVKALDKKKWLEMKGNLSGRPTFKRSNNCIKLTRKHFKNRFTIIGTGGIFTGEDALKKIELGADLVQIATGMIYNGPQIVGQINQFLTEHT